MNEMKEKIEVFFKKWFPTYRVQHISISMDGNETYININLKHDGTSIELIEE